MKWNARQLLRLPKRLISLRHNSTSFITTPIFYVNANPHIGHLYTALLADAYHRFNLLLGVPSVLSTGTDEHGIKVQQAAEQVNSELKAYCDTVSQKYKDIFHTCGVHYTHFIRTTDDVHKSAVTQFWNCLVDKGHIIPGSYSGWYCDPDEAFLTENQLKVITRDGKEVKVSAESGHPVHWVEEQNYKFTLSQFQSDLLHWLKQGGRVKPVKFEKQLLMWIEENGLMSGDVSVSRPVNRVHWGVRVPGDPSQSIYVWLDALVSYLTVAGYPNVLTHWPPTLQVIGKDILKFHGIYWPAFLMAAGFDPPECLFVHSHWTIENEKMSKSRKNVVCPFERSEKCSPSGLRYFLLREGTPHSDSNYSEVKLMRILNAELADTLGNLLSRCSGKTVNKGQCYPQFSDEDFNKYCSESGAALIDALNRLPDEVKSHYSELNFYKGVTTIISTLHEANRFFEASKPWELKKSPDLRRHLECVLHLTMESLRLSGIALQPIVPDLASLLLDKLSVPVHSRGWADLVPSWNQSVVATTPLSTEKIILYKRIL